MVYNATKLIKKSFDSNDINCRIRETESTSAVEAGFSGENAPNFIVRFISTDDDNDVAIRILSFVKVPEKKRAAVLDAINSLQRRFRYVNYTIDDDGDVNIGIDLPMRTQNVGDVCVEMFIRIVKIADDSYPVLMKAIWS